MTWNTKIGDTAKVSYERRILLLDRIDAVIDNLDRLRVRAMQYASPESIGAIAPEIQLPRPSSEEAEELKDTSRRQDFPWLSDVSVRPRESVFTEQIEEFFVEGGGEEVYDIDGSWFEVVMNASHDIDPFELLDWIYPEDTDYEGDIKMTDRDEIDHADQSFILEDPIHGEIQSPDGVSDAWGTEAVRHAEEHIFLTPWGETFPVQLRGFLDEIDEYRAQPRGFNVLLDDDMSAPSVGGSEYEEDSTDFHSPSVAESLMDFLQEKRHADYPVTTEHLQRLQRDIQQVLECRHQMCRSMWDMRAALNRREHRYRMRQNNGDITMVMRSRGMGSPLSFGMGVDEETDQDNNWGLLPGQSPRKKIYGLGASAASEPVCRIDHDGRLQLEQVEETNTGSVTW